MPKPILRKNDLVILINENIKLLNELDKSINIVFVNEPSFSLFDKYIV